MQWTETRPESIDKYGWVYSAQRWLGVENSTRSAGSETLKPAHVAPTTMPCSKLTHVPLLPHSDAQLELQQLSCPVVCMPKNTELRPCN